MSEPVMKVRAWVVDVHFDNADRGKDGYSAGRSESGVAKIMDENGKKFEVGVYAPRQLLPGNPAPVYGGTAFLKDGYLTNAGLAAAGYEIDPLADFR